MSRAFDGPIDELRARDAAEGGLAQNDDGSRDSDGITISEQISSGASFGKTSMIWRAVQTAVG